MKTVCTSPEAAELLPAYIVDQLDDAEAETVQNHLNDCPRCKNYYLTMIEARAEAQEPAPIPETQEQTTFLSSAAKPVQPPSTPVRRKGKASGSPS